MKKKLGQDILLIAVLSLTVSLLWIYLGVHSALKKSEKTLLTPAETKVLVPKLDTEVFEELKKRKS